MNTSGFEAEQPSRYDDVSAAVESFSFLTLPVAEKIVSIAALEEGQKFLDIGTGTGIIANLAARQAKPGVGVLGVDFSDGMLDLARAIASREKLDGRVEYQLMDAQDLTLEDGSFDVVVSLYTFMHLPSPETALREIYRVLKPGGRAVIGVGGPPPVTSLAGWRHRLRMVRLTPARLQGKALLAPELLNSLVKQRLSFSRTAGTVPRRWENPRRAITQMAREVGFRRTRFDWEGQIVPIPSSEEFWSLQNTFSSFARQQLIDAPPGLTEAIRGDFMSACEDVVGRGGCLLYHYGALLGIAHKA